MTMHDCIGGRTTRGHLQNCPIFPVRAAYLVLFLSLDAMGDKEGWRGIQSTLEPLDWIQDKDGEEKSQEEPFNLQTLASAPNPITHALSPQATAPPRS